MTFYLDAHTCVPPFLHDLVPDSNLTALAWYMAEMKITLHKKQIKLTKIQKNTCQVSACSFASVSGSKGADSALYTTPKYTLGVTFVLGCTTGSPSLSVCFGPLYNLVEEFFLSRFIFCLVNKNVFNFKIHVGRQAHAGKTIGSLGVAPQGS